MVEVVFFDLGQTLVRSGGGVAWIPGAAEALRSLHDGGARLGILSNTGTLSRADLGPLLPADFPWSLFEDDLVLLSAEVGLSKPDLRIFLEAVRRAAAPPSHCLFCTEDLVDALQAQRAGMRALRVGEPATNGLSELGDALAREHVPSP